MEVKNVQEANHSEVFVRLIVKSAIPDAVTMEEISLEVKQDKEMQALNDAIHNSQAQPGTVGLSSCAIHPRKGSEQMRNLI